jgi:hypothetical protein
LIAVLGGLAAVVCFIRAAMLNEVSQRLTGTGPFAGLGEAIGALIMIYLAIAAVLACIGGVLGLVSQAAAEKR